MSKRYPAEQRERAVKMALDHLHEYNSVYGACKAIEGPVVLCTHLVDELDYLRRRGGGYLPFAGAELRDRQARA